MEESSSSTTTATARDQSRVQVVRSSLLPHATSTSTSRLPPIDSRRSSTTSTASSSSRMLATHPSALPNYYDSTASTSGDEGDLEEYSKRYQHHHGGEKKYNHNNHHHSQSKTTRRIRQASAPNSAPLPQTSIFPLRDTNNDAVLASPGGKRRTGSHFVGPASPNGGKEATRRLAGEPQRMPVVYGQEGLGFVVGLPETDYQVIVDGAASSNRADRRRSTTYSSSIGSAAPSPLQQSSPFPPPARSRQRSRQMSEQSLTNSESYSNPAIRVDDYQSNGASRASLSSTTSHVRFDGVPPERRGMRRPRPTSIAINLESDHIVFPDTMPPSQLSPPLPISPTSATRPESISSLRRPPSIASLRRPASIASSINGTGGGYASSTPSVATRASARLIPESPLAGSTSRYVPGSPRARSARRPNGPTTIVGDMIAQQDPSRLYFPPPPPSSRARSVSSNGESTSRPSPPLSLISSVFPSKPKPGSPSLNGIESSPTPSMAGGRFHSPPFPSAPGSTRSIQSSVFPSRPRPTESRTPATPSTTFSPSTSTNSVGPFPPPPSRSPQARFVPRMSSSASTATDLTASPSFPSTLSSSTSVPSSIDQPVFPTLGAQLASDGIVRASISPRRVSQAPWEYAGGGEDAGFQHRRGGYANDGDELDRMMAAQRRTASDEEGKVEDVKAKDKDKERKRKSIYNELMRTHGVGGGWSEKSPSSRSTNGGGAGEELDSFQRELMARDTVKKSLGAKLMSEEPETPGEVSDEDAASTGLTPSTSTSSEISTLPSFPDVPTHAYQNGTSPLAIPTSREQQDQVEVVVSEATPSTTPTISNAFPSANGSARAKHGRHVSLASSSEMSNYEDAPEEIVATEESTEETEAKNGDARQPTLELSKQQTSLWVLDTLASTVDSPARKLTDIGEAEEPEEVLKQEELVSTEPVVPSSPSTSLPPAIPSSPATSLPRTMQPLERTASPTLSHASRSTASSAAPVSYTAPKRIVPAPNGSVKSKLTFGKKLGAFFGSQPSYNAAALGLRGSGISSRDVARLDRSSSNQDSSSPVPSKPSYESSGRRSSEWDTHTRSTSHSSSTYSAFPPIPQTPSSFSSSTFPVAQQTGQSNPQFRITPPSATGRPSISSTSEPLSIASAASGSSSPEVNTLANLLSRFEQEEKERFKGIATSRLSKTTNSQVVA